MDAGLPGGVIARLRWRPPLLAAVQAPVATAGHRAGIGRVSVAALALHDVLARRWQPGRSAATPAPAGLTAAPALLRPPGPPPEVPGGSGPGPSGPVGSPAPARGPSTAPPGPAPTAPGAPRPSQAPPPPGAPPPRPAGPPEPQPPPPSPAAGPDPAPGGRLRRSPLRLASLPGEADRRPDGRPRRPPARPRALHRPPPGRPATHPAPPAPPATRPASSVAPAGDPGGRRPDRSPAALPDVRPPNGADPGQGRLLEAATGPLVLPGLELRPAAGPAGPPATPPRPPGPAEAGPASPPGDHQAPGDGRGRPAPPGAPAVDLDAVAERVIQRLARHHRMEQDRRGWS
jgi:hypothetical protein